MSRLTEKLRAVGVYNAYGFAGRGNAYIIYIPAETLSGRWAVVRPGYRTDPTAHWMEHGNKTFTGSGDKKQGLENSKKWASARYGIKEWERTPYRSYMDAEFVKSRINELKQKAR